MKTRQTNLSETTKSVKSIFAAAKREQLSVSAVIRNVGNKLYQTKTFAGIVGTVKSVQREAFRNKVLSHLPQVVTVSGETIFIDLVAYKELKGGAAHTLLRSVSIPRKGISIEFGADVQDFVELIQKVPETRTILDESGNNVVCFARDSQGKIQRKERFVKYSVRKKNVWGYSADMEFAVIKAVEELCAETAVPEAAAE